MSILNMVLGGGGSDGFKMARSSSVIASAADFTIDSAPQEYIVMCALTGDVALTITQCLGFICDTTSYDLIGYGRPWSSYSEFATVTSSTALSNITTSYSNGVFTVHLTSTSDYKFYTSASYILFYR